MKDLINEILKEYLTIYPNEEERQKRFKDFLLTNDIVTDWNNFDGHLVAGAFVYAKKDKKLLFMYHKDLKMYLYPGGHIDKDDSTPLEAAFREVREETGLDQLKPINITSNNLIPIDIDTQLIEYNERLDLPSHYHYDFRYLFTIDEIKEVKIDADELRDYKWVDYEEIRNMSCYANVREKLIDIIKKEAN